MVKRKCFSRGCEKSFPSGPCVARESSYPTKISLARSVGHVAATAHMADHSLGAAWYALNAVKNAGKSVEQKKNGRISNYREKLRSLF